MRNNQVHSEGTTANNGSHKWYHRRWFAVICISFIFLAIIAIILSLLLKFVILAPRESEITNTTEALPSLKTIISTTSSTTTEKSSTTTEKSSTTTEKSSTTTETTSTTTETTSTTTETTTTTTTQQSGSFNTGSMNHAREQHTASILPHETVLVTGGYNGPSLNSAELYNLSTGTWTITGSMNTARRSHISVFTNGKVLVAGGLNNNNVRLNSAELYDTSTETWKTIDSMNNARTFHTASLLTTGKVLVTGGGGSDVTAVLNSAELYDPSTETWTTTDSMNVARFSHTASILINGKVLVAGGGNIDRRIVSLDSAELYDPLTETWTVTRSMNIARRGHTATVLTNGKVLVTGGFGYSGMIIDSVELYDPSTETWTVTCSMNMIRTGHAASLLTNGKVLVTGSMTGGSLSSTELYDPSTETWTFAASMNDARSHHTASVLTNGKVLITGGVQHNTALNTVELYSLF